MPIRPAVSGRSLRFAPRQTSSPSWPLGYPRRVGRCGVPLHCDCWRSWQQSFPARRKLAWCRGKSAGPAAASLAPQELDADSRQNFPRSYDGFTERGGTVGPPGRSVPPQPQGVPALPMRVAVVGHVEWMECAGVERGPRAGEIVHASDAWEEPAGGGAVAAVQLARLAGTCLFLTALGDDELGHRAKRGLEEHGVRVEAAWRPEPQRRGFVHLDAAGERTITVIGERLGPDGSDGLPWSELAECDAVYFTAGDAGAL